MTTEDPRLINLGTFAEGARPPSVTYQILDGDGDPEDMTSGSWTAQCRGEQLEVASQPSPLFDGTPSVDTGSSVVSYVFSVNDFATVGRFRFILWAGNGVNRLGSPVFEYTVIDAPGAAPTV